MKLLRSKSDGKLFQRRFASWGIPSAVFLLFLIVYGSLPTTWYTYDAVAYASHIRNFTESGKAGWLFHPHHLLFNSLGLITWRIMNFIGISSDPLGALQYMNAFFGALGLALTYVLLRRGTLGRRTNGTSYQLSITQSLAAVLMLGSAFGYWACATDGRVNMPGIVGVILVVGLAWSMLESPTLGRCILMACDTVLAVGLHQSHGLLLAAGLGAVAFSQIPWKKRIGFGALYLTTVFTGIALMYVSVGVAFKHVECFADLKNWALAYAHDGRWWSFSISHNLMLDVKAIIHAFVGGTVNRTSIQSNWTWFMAVPTLCVVLPMAVRRMNIGSKGLGQVWMDESGLIWRKVGVVALVAAPYAAFFTLWNPGYFVFWMPVAFALVAAWALIGSGVNRPLRSSWVTVSLVWAAVALTSSLSVLVPRTSQRSNSSLVTCESLRRVAGEGDMVLMTGSGLGSPGLEVYIPYFNRMSLKSLSWEIKHSDRDLQRTVKSVRSVTRKRIQSGHQVFILPEFVGAAPWGEMEQRYGTDQEFAMQILDGYRLEPVTESDKVIAYKLVPEKTQMPDENMNTAETPRPRDEPTPIPIP